MSLDLRKGNPTEKKNSLIEKGILRMIALYKALEQPMQTAVVNILLRSVKINAKLKKKKAELKIVASRE